MLEYLKLKFYKYLQKKHKQRKTGIFNYTVFYKDARSLFSEYKIIFKNRTYHFESNNKSPTIIDGGGHIGLATLYFKYIYPDSRVTIFEPDQSSLEILRKNINQNRFENVSIIESGLYSQDGKIRFQENNSGGGKISETGKELTRVEKLSKYVNSDVDFLKLNIEGAELEVLKDLQSHNKLKHIKEMCVEWHSFSGQSQNLGELLLILERNRFKYLINHFDYNINPHLKPPFNLTDKSQYYLIIYAKKI